VSDVTRILQSLEGGEARAGGTAEELLPLVYEELRKLAQIRMAQESPDQTLQPTALVHEAWLRLTGNREDHWNNHAHFICAAAEAMRRILIERARRKRSLKRGAGAERLHLDLDQMPVATQSEPDELLALNDALEKLAAEDLLSAELIKLRFFAGMTQREAARALGISERSAKRYWTFDRVWLLEEIRNPGAARGELPAPESG